MENFVLGVSAVLKEAGIHILLLYYSPLVRGFVFGVIVATLIYGFIYSASKEKENHVYTFSNEYADLVNQKKGFPFRRLIKIFFVSLKLLGFTAITLFYGIVFVVLIVNLLA